MIPMVIRVLAALLGFAVFVNFAYWLLISEPPQDPPEPPAED